MVQGISGRHCLAKILRVETDREKDVQRLQKVFTFQHFPLQTEGFLLFWGVFCFGVVFFFLGFLYEITCSNQQ